MRSSFRLNRIGLAPALALSSAIVMLALTFVVLQSIGASAAAQVESEIGHMLAELSFQTTDKLDQGMFERYREVKLMAERHEITEQSVAPAEKRRVLERMQSTYPRYAWIGLTDRQGKVLVSTGGLLEGANVGQRPWFGAAYRGQHMTDVHEAVLLAKLLPGTDSEPKRFFDIAFPYKDRQGRVAGVLGTHLSWQWARDIERSVLRPMANRRAVDTLIVSQAGVVLLGPERYRDAVLRQQSLDRAKTGRSGSIIETWPDGKRYLVGYHRSQGYGGAGGLGWTVLVRQELKDAYRPVRALERDILWGGVAASIAVSLLMWAFARRITRPLSAITRNAADLRTDTHGRIPIIPTRFVEVRILRHALNSLLRKVQSTEQGLRDMNATLEARVRERTGELHRAVEETRLSEMRVRAVIDTALDAFVGVDQQGNITDWNRRAEEIFGWSRDEVLGRSVAATIIPAPLRAAHSRGLRDFAITGNSNVVGKRLQLTAMRRDGEEFPIEMTIGLVNAGAEHFFGAFIQDISVRKKIEDELATERELLDAVLDSIDVGVVVCSAGGEVRLLNRAARDLHGLPAAALPLEAWSRQCGLFDAQGHMPLAPDRMPLLRAAKGEVVRNEEVTVNTAGTLRSLLASGRGLTARDGMNIGAVIALKDVTGLKESQRQLKANERLLRTITDNLPVLIAYIDTEERYRFANATHEKWIGIPAGQMVGKTVREVLGEEVYAGNAGHLRDNLAGRPVRFETTTTGPKGDRIIDVAGFPDLDGGVVKGAIVLSTDITAIKRYQEELNRLARIDTLTGLPNRRNYEERLPEAARRASRSGGSITLMFLDIDRFKQINDTLGHAGGDLVLKEFAHRVRGAVRATDLVSRLAGDEFTVLIEGLRDGEEAVLVARKIVASFEAPLAIEGASRQVSTSIGIAFQNAGPFDIDALSRAADEALYRVKEDGRNGCALNILAPAAT